MSRGKKYDRYEMCMSGLRLVRVLLVYLKLWVDVAVVPIHPLLSRQCNFSLHARDGEGLCSWNPMEII